MSEAAQTTIVSEWIEATNSHDTARYLAYFADDGILDDPSVGEVYEGHAAIGEYFTSFFIGYDTQTRLVRAEPRDGHLHVEVDFTGSFPGGQTDGTFDIEFAADQRFSRVLADLITA